MKQHPPTVAEELESASHQLAKAMLQMKTEDECLSLLDDLCTPAELEAIVDRWRVAQLLDRDLPYREIHDRTGVSVTTIGRVARFISRGAGGYRLALERLREKRRAADKTAAASENTVTPAATYPAQD